MLEQAISYYVSRFTFVGRCIANWLYLEKPNKSLSSVGFNFAAGVSVMPKTITGSLGGIDLSKPRKVVITFGGKV